MDKIEKIRAEVERYIKHYKKLKRNDFRDGELYICYELLFFIDSLQQEQQEEDLEKDFSKAWTIHPIPKEFIPDLLEKRGLLEFIYKTSLHFYKLGKNSK